MSERDFFLQALSENEDDSETRLFYADWLDEQGEHEESDRQRKWPAAKAWLVKFCQANNPPPENPYEIDVISPEDLISKGRHAIQRVLASRDKLSQFGSMENMLLVGWRELEGAQLIDSRDRWAFSIGFSNNEEMCYALGAQCEEFWTNFSILTGIPLPPQIVEKSSFRCSC